MKCITLSLSLILFLALPLSSLSRPTAIQAEKTIYCSNEAEANIDQAISYLRMNLATLKRDYEFDAKLPRKDDRVRDRMQRKIDDIKVNCATRLRCRDSTGTSMGIITDKIHICYEKARERGINFCQFVGIIAHEYGHMIGMPREIGHNRSEPMDATEMFGRFVGDLCRQDRLDRALSDTSRPLTPNPPAPTSGIVIFPRENWEGRGRNFTGDFADTRQIGWADMASSVRVLSGAWEVCEKPDFRGWCHVLSSSQSRLKDISFNDEISSLRRITLPRSGITIFQKKDFGGGSHNFTTAIADVSAAGINNEMSSLQVHSGRWEVCADKNFRGRCQTISASQSDLSRLNLNNKISSLRPR